MSGPKKSSTWIPVIEKFVSDLRIDSKEHVATDGRGVPLELWESQRRYLDELGRGLDDGIRYFFYLKSRQLGITTISLAIDALWMALHNGLIGCLVTDTEANRDANRQILTRYINSFEEGYFGGDFRIEKSNRQFMLFSNGSRLDFLVAGTKEKSISWAEGRGYSFAHITEPGKFGSPKGLETLEEAFAQTNPNRLFIYEGTANGFNAWRTKWLSAARDPIMKRAVFIGWWASKVNVVERSDPRFEKYGLYPASGEEREKITAVASLYGHRITPEQLAWFRWREDNVSPQDEGIFEQNQPWTSEDAFIQSGHSFFQTRMLTKLLKDIYDAPPAMVEDGGYGFQGYRYDVDGGFFNIKMHVVEADEGIDAVELRVWEEPAEDGRYAIGFDPAWGRTEWSDRHAIQVFRCYADKMVQVAEYATADVEMKHAAWVLAHLAGAYSNCMINIDLNGPGRMLMHEWDNIKGQLNAEMNQQMAGVGIKVQDWENALGNARWYLYNRPDSLGRGYAANFESTSRTKGEIMHQMRGEFVTNALVIRSPALLLEMQNVIQDGDSIGAPESADENSKDDRVFATALAIRAWINWIRQPMLMEGLTYSVVTQRERGEATMHSQRLMGIVDRFFKSQQEMADATPRDNPFLLKRGLR